MIPIGWKLVPIHPTTAMRLAGMAANNGQGMDFADHTYAEMLRAAPEPPQDQVVMPRSSVRNGSGWAVGDPHICK